MSEMEKSHAASGVEALIDRLRQQGVDKGQEEAAQLIAEAQHRADWLIEQAEQEAKQIRDKAMADAERLRKGGEDALKIAARDVQLLLREALGRVFADRVRILVSEQLDDAEFMQSLLREVVCAVRDNAELDSKSVEVLLPAQFVGIDELRRNPNAYREGKLSNFVQQLLAEQLREGVSFDIGDQRGLVLRFEGEDAEMDLSDRALSELLLRHLQPRFRALLEGVIR
ncbi:ATPase [Marinobacterium mangrovicola]|uniref:V/A-type H+-transporting ATPase subunit E n=1 Tax=Marinobacterium mangrovicola TaxID=1476959 RepID=A0A4R1GDM2_9GAMM|nr:ATPase [Marinobacterium mangrovicola]TCK04920.1 V/A-type H+-transporting ATPase subunit E [Marinobacterium mangrovicola]